VHGIIWNQPFACTFSKATLYSLEFSPQSSRLIESAQHLSKLHNSSLNPLTFLVFNLKMSFCSICEMVPFLELPPLPRVQVTSRIVFRDQVLDQTDYTLYRLGFESGLPAAAIGAPHAENFEDLFASAPFCRICRLIAQGLRNIQSKCDQTSSSEDFRPCGQLRLCASPLQNDGFIVMSPSPCNSKFPVGSFESYVVVAEAGFCVDAGNKVSENDKCSSLT